MQTNQQTPETAKIDHFAALFEIIGASKSAVSRDFKRLTREQRTLLCAVADVDYHCTLSHYTKDEKTQIGKAFRSVRQLADAFRKGVTINDFRHADEVQHDDN